MTSQPPTPQPWAQQPQYHQAPCQPPYWAPPPQANRDDEHLRLLSIFHYVLGGIVGFFACFPCIHVAVGVLMVTGRMPSGGSGPPPQAFGWVFVIMGSVFILLGWTLAILLLIAAGRLRKRRGWTFCFVVACISCLFMPMGTVLGVFTILVLSRETVKAAFGQVRAAG
jgi:hypothetical protein